MARKKSSTLLVCDKCGKRLNSNQSYGAHMRNVHKIYGGVSGILRNNRRRAPEVLPDIPGDIESPDPVRAELSPQERRRAQARQYYHRRKAEKAAQAELDWQGSAAEAGSNGKVRSPLDDFEVADMVVLKNKRTGELWVLERLGG